MKDLEKKFGKNVASTPTMNVANRTLDVAVEMFTYLNSCPDTKLINLYF